MRLSYSNIASTLALLGVVSGGSAYALDVIDGSLLKPGSVTGGKLKNNTVTGDDIKNRGIGLTDLTAGTIKRLDSLSGAECPRGNGFGNTVVSTADNGEITLYCTAGQAGDKYEPNNDAAHAAEGAIVSKNPSNPLNPIWSRTFDANFSSASDDDWYRWPPHDLANHSLVWAVDKNTIPTGLAPMLDVWKNGKLFSHGRIGPYPYGNNIKDESATNDDTYAFHLSAPAGYSYTFLVYSLE